MTSLQKAPPMTEDSFRRWYCTMWDITGAACLAIGLGIGPWVIRARRPWFTFVVGCSVYLFSILLNRVVLMSVWRRPHVTPPVLYFSIPVGTVGLVALLAVNGLSSHFGVGRRSLFCFGLSVGLLYVASLIWAIGMGIHRKKMGEFHVEDRR